MVPFLNQNITNKHTQMMKFKTSVIIAIFVVAAAALSTAKPDTSDKGKIAREIEIVG